MGEFEKEEIKNRIKGMSEEELLAFLKFVPTDLLWEELRGREKSQRKIILEVKNALCKQERD